LDAINRFSDLNKIRLSSKINTTKMGIKINSSEIETESYMSKLIKRQIK